MLNQHTKAVVLLWITPPILAFGGLFVAPLLPDDTIWLYLAPICYLLLGGWSWGVILPATKAVIE